MADLIDRQAAIDALLAWEESSVWDEDCIKHRGEPYWVAPSDVIAQLPSAQPEILRCKDCVHWEKYTAWSPEPDLHVCVCGAGRIITDADDFCGYAERREE